MKDLFELLGKIFSRKNKPKVKHHRSEGINYNSPHNRYPLPEIPPPGPPSTPREATLLKKKTRINELEKEIAELRAESSRQVELLEQLARQLSSLQRSVAHLLPEK